MTTLSLDSAVVPRYRASGWLISIATHTIATVAAVLLTTNLHLASQPEPFRWQISVTQPPAPQSAEVPPAPQPKPAPTPKATQPPKLVQKPAMPTEQRIEQVRAVTQVAQAVTPVAHQEIRKVEPVIQPEQSLSELVQSKPTITREMESVNQTAEIPVLTNSAATPLTEAVTTQSKQAETSAVVTHEVMERADSSITEQTPILERAVASVTPQVTESAAVPIETAAVQTRPVAESSLSQQPVESLPVETSVTQTMPVAETSAVHQVPTDSIQQASIQAAPAQSLPATKADYSWLLQALWSRVEQLKRYPHLARVNRWEGLVVLKAVINQEGQLLDLKVAESSGHSVLDQDALDVMRRSCPLNLKHPLGKPQVELRVPISYKLR